MSNPCCRVERNRARRVGFFGALAALGFGGMGAAIIRALCEQFPEPTLPSAAAFAFAILTMVVAIIIAVACLVGDGGADTSSAKRSEKS
jgi:hypothetical protein